MHEHRFDDDLPDTNCIYVGNLRTNKYIVMSEPTDHLYEIIRLSFQRGIELVVIHCTDAYHVDIDDYIKKDEPWELCKNWDELVKEAEPDESNYMTGW
jgi:sugar phosphate isomerase/epimerase